MGRLAELISFARRTVEGAKVSDAQADPGGGANVTAQHFGPAGDDGHPMPGDTVIMVQASGSGREAAIAYLDPANDPKAAEGEKRIYARDGDGAVVGEVWLKADGTIVVENEGGGAMEMAPGGDVTINGVVIDTSGNIVAPGDVTALDGPNSVTLSTHTHPDSMGGTGSPVPGS